MNVVNCVRGQHLFAKKIDGALILDQEALVRLILLKGKFESRVSVVPQDDNGVYGAARMAKACIATASKSIADSDLESAAITAYFDLLQKDTEELNPTNAKLRKPTDNNYYESAKLDLEASSFQQEMMSVDQIEKRENGVEILDLIKGLHSSYLTQEGKRSVGILPANFDSLNNVKVQETPQEELPLAQVKAGKNNDVIYGCPFCRSESLYPSGPAQFTCFDCGKSCEADINLEDFLVGDTQADDKLLIKVSNVVQPGTGIPNDQARHRIGKITKRIAK